MKQLKKFLNKNYILYYDVLGDDYLYSTKINEKITYIDPFKLKPLDERARNSILIRYIEEKKKDISITKFNTLIESDFTKEFNPFENYIKNLVPSNGAKELDKLIDSIKTSDSDYLKFVLTKWLVAFVACAIDDNASNHCMLILVGKQGIGKSTWCKNLLPPELKYYYYSGEMNPSNKDHLAYLSDKLIINVDELSGYNKKSLEAFKEIMTKADYSIRRPYGRRNANFIRRASFTGSSNSNDILIDLSGNRRFLCLDVESINYNYKINYDALYSEIYNLYQSGFEYWFNDDDTKRVEKYNEKFLAKSLEEEIILNNVINYKKYNHESEEEIDFEWMTATELIGKLTLYVPRGHKLDPSCVGKILTKENFEFKTTNGTRKYHLSIMDLPRGKSKLIKKEFFERKRS